MRASTLWIALALAGCRIGTLSPEELDRAYPLARLTTLGQPGRDDSLAALRDAVGTPVRVTTLSFTEHMTSILAQNPRSPQDFDHYTYWKGDVTSRAETMRSGDEERLTARLFDLDSVPLDKLPALARRAIQELAIDGARVSSLNVGRGDSGLEIVVSLQGPRRSGRVTFDGAGNLLSTHRD